ncbi:hypothetical protein BT63DRAFT_426302 [Microthyrium microscopicum]|uniref:Uncharacterized protein n=1 Tax=Microthyrium microscopicum TaxID=703497 RepID=A0A6A6U810_9PEZI|nr:hypothetical protein BT63DRAFT_426302 [Microthyrium microscopicum]
MGAIKSRSTSTIYAVITVSSLLLASSLLTLALKASSMQLYNDQTSSGQSVTEVFFEVLDPHKNFMFPTYPQALLPDLSTLVLVAASFCLVCAVGFIISAARILRVEKSIKLHKSQWLLSLAFLASITILILAVTITTIVQLFQTSHFPLPAILNGTISDSQFDNLVFELGTWSCETKDLPSFAGYGLAQQCAILSILHFSMMFQFLLAAMLLIIIWWDKRGGQQFFRERRYIFLMTTEMLSWNRRADQGNYYFF